MEIYRRYGPALLRKCERILRNREDAEDVVQTLFMDLLNKGKTGVDLPYLYRAATNRCLNLMRDRRRRLALLEREQISLAPPPRTGGEERTLELDLVVKLAARLDRKSAEILVYRYFDDMTQDEIAELLHTSRKTVGKRMNKIRQAVLELSAESDRGAS